MPKKSAVAESRRLSNSPVSRSSRSAMSIASSPNNSQQKASKNLGISSLADLVGICIALAGGRRGLRLDKEESKVAKGCSAPSGADVDRILPLVMSDEDVLGREYCLLKSVEERRSHGATFTPAAIVNSMLDWAEAHIRPEAIVDPGAGSARYAIAAARRFPAAKVVAVEIDPVLRIVAKARIAVLGLSDRIRVESSSFLDLPREKIDGPILYIGNPPYVRHHDLDPAEKTQHAERCRALGIPASGLTGLHVHFMVKAFEMARAGDALAFITAAEWLDTNYGKGIRALLASGSHEASVDLFGKEDLVFEDALASAAITCVQFGKAAGKLRLGKIKSGKPIHLGKGESVALATAKDASSWNNMPSGTKESGLEGTLGDLFKVSRGMVTGMNSVWVQSSETPPLPERFLRPCITQAEDITSAKDGKIACADGLRKIILLPESLDDLPKNEKKAVERFLKWAKAKGADSTFTAKQRKVWWSIAPKAPPPIVMTYMGRRPPVFARNIAGAMVLNIAHGLYPKTLLSTEEQETIVAWLNKNVAASAGRSYAGGLVKFEPGEAMRIGVPELSNPSWRLAA